MVSLDNIKQLRQETGVSISECKKALEESAGDFEKAKDVLRKWGKQVAGKKASREAGVGYIETYLHPNKKIGVMLELRCETDFVARSEDFQKLAHELCMQIAAMNPLYVLPEDIPEEFLAGEKKIFQEQVAGSGKPKNIVDQIIEGKLNKYKEEVSLVSQFWVKDDSKTIKDLMEEAIAKIGENIYVKRFVRYEV